MKKGKMTVGFVIMLILVVAALIILASFLIIKIDVIKIFFDKLIDSFMGKIG